MVVLAFLTDPDVVYKIQKCLEKQNEIKGSR